MFFQKYQVGLLIRILLLTVSIGLMLYWLFIDIHLLRCVYISLIIIYLVWSIFWSLNRINRDFYTFISALSNEEYSVQFSSEKRDKRIEQLYQLYNTTAQRFQKVKYERDLQHLFLEEIMNQIEVGILAYDNQMKVALLNNAFKNLFKCKKPSSINEFAPEILSLLEAIKPGSKKMVFPVIDGQKLVLSAHSTQFVIKEKKLTLVYFHNIKSEMDEQELESWQKLFSVLTHEIMNSVTPISSLTSSLNLKLKNEISNQGSARNKTLELLSEGLDAVFVRSKGLLSFTESFRQLSKMPKPKPVELEINKVFTRIRALYDPIFKEKNINFTYTISNDCKFLYADPQQIEQLFINIIKNSVEAIDMKRDGKIEILVQSASGKKTAIEFLDNGKGIAADNLERVFVPFYTTKSNGSGVGLSLCRQIIRMHGGSIDLRSEEGKGTLVRIIL